MKTMGYTNDTKYHSIKVQRRGVFMRNNLDSSYVNNNSPAISKIEGNLYLETTMPAALLVVGNNCLAAEVHLKSQDNQVDDDLLFDCELRGLYKKPVTEKFISFEATVWKYHHSSLGPHDGTNTAESNSVDPNWPNTVYVDTNWSSGQAVFGYGERDQNFIVTELFHDPNAKVFPPTTYFRKTFSVSDPGAYTHLQLMLLQDDGAVVYVNGHELMRANMPTGAITHNTPPIKAIGSADEGRYIVSQIDLSAVKDLTLQEGNSNVLAVEVHQHPAELGAMAST